MFSLKYRRSSWKLSTILRPPWCLQCHRFVEGAPADLAHPCRYTQAGAKAICGIQGLSYTKRDIRKLIVLLLLQLGSFLYYKGTRCISRGRKEFLDGFGAQILTLKEWYGPSVLHPASKYRFCGMTLIFGPANLAFVVQWDERWPYDDKCLYFFFFFPSWYLRCRLEGAQQGLAPEAEASNISAKLYHK